MITMTGDKIMAGLFIIAAVITGMLILYPGGDPMTKWRFRALTVAILAACTAVVLWLWRGPLT